MYLTHLSVYHGGHLVSPLAMSELETLKLYLSLCYISIMITGKTRVSKKPVTITMGLRGVVEDLEGLGEAGDLYKSLEEGDDQREGLEGVGEDLEGLEEAGDQRQGLGGLGEDLEGLEEAGDQCEGLGELGKGLEGLKGAGEILEGLEGSGEGLEEHEDFSGTCGVAPASASAQA